MFELNKFLLLLLLMSRDIRPFNLMSRCHMSRNVHLCISDGLATSVIFCHPVVLSSTWPGLIQKSLLTLPTFCSEWNTTGSSWERAQYITILRPVRSAWTASRMCECDDQCRVHTTATDNRLKSSNCRVEFLSQNMKIGRFFDALTNLLVHIWGGKGAKNAGKLKKCTWKFRL